MNFCIVIHFVVIIPFVGHKQREAREAMSIEKKEEFSFTHEIENWKESTTIQYKKISIGAYQIKIKEIV